MIAREPERGHRGKQGLAKSGLCPKLQKKSPLDIIIQGKLRLRVILVF